MFDLNNWKTLKNHEKPWKERNMCPKKTSILHHLEKNITIALPQKFDYRSSLFHSISEIVQGTTSACTIVCIQFISKVEPDSIVASNDAASPPISWPCSLHHSQSSRPVWKVQSADEQELRQHRRRRAPVRGVPGKPEEDRQAQLWGAHLDHGSDQVCWLDQVQTLPLLPSAEKWFTPFIGKSSSPNMPAGGCQLPPDRRWGTKSRSTWTTLSGQVGKNERQNS